MTKKEYDYNRYLKNRDKLLEHSKEYQRDNKEKRREYNRKYRLENKDRLKELEKRRSSDPIRKAHRQKYQREWYKNNPGYFKEKAKKYYNQNIEYHRKWRLREKEEKAGIKKRDKCEICGENGKIVYDHSHKTGLFRGWICAKCNCSLGYAKDDVKILKAMIKYIEKNGQ